MGAVPVSGGLRGAGGLGLALLLAGAPPALAAEVGRDATPPPPDLESLIRAMTLPVPAGTETAGRAPGDPFIDVGRGPIPVIVPTSYDPAIPTPVVILLHGYTSSGSETEDYMQFARRAEEFGFLYLFPDGTRDCFGQRFWNATDACCNFCGSGVDDSGYLLAVIDEMKRLYNVDAGRVFFVGHSNGGFMSYRMACDHPDEIAAITSLAGATFLDPEDCGPAAPVHVLQIHGTADAVIGYGGGCIAGICYPGAVGTVEQWAAFDGCDPEGKELPERLNLDAEIPGDETVVTRYAADCEPGGSAELWTIEGGAHVPNLSEDFGRLVAEFLLSHPKPTACPEDLDESGTVDFADLLAVLAAWGPCDGCPEDLDGSGAVDFADLLAVLAAWGPCD